MNFLQVTVARILVKVSPGKLQKTRKGIRFIHFCFAGGPVVSMTVHSMIKLLKEIILNRYLLKTPLVMEKVVTQDLTFTKIHLRTITIDMQTLLPRIVTRLGRQTVKFLERILSVQPRILLKVSQATPLRQLALSRITIMRTLNLSRKMLLVTVTLSEVVSRRALSLLLTRIPLALVASVAASVLAAARIPSV